MKQYIAALAVGLLVLGSPPRTQAEGDKDVNAILDKAIQALGGAENLGKVKAATWKTKGKINIMDTENEMTTEGTFEGLDKYRGQFEGDFNGMKIKGITVLNGNKGWFKFGEMGSELDENRLASQKREVYLVVTTMTILPLKSKEFKVQLAGEEKVGDKPAVGLKVTAPDGKDFTLYFDKQSGLPVKQVAKVADFQGNEVTQESFYDGYKEFDGIKRATKLTSKRDGMPFISGEITEFKILDKVDPKTFLEP
jgi:hypothetical protein